MRFWRAVGCSLLLFGLLGCRSSSVMYGEMKGGTTNDGSAPTPDDVVR